MASTSYRHDALNLLIIELSQFSKGHPSRRIEAGKNRESNRHAHEVVQDP